MILAAGFGTRLRPITERIPKPLVPVVGRPNISRTIEQLGRLGIRELAINLHHLPDAIRAALGDGSDLGAKIAYSEERPEILGTGGGIRRALPLLGDGTFAVVNGDALFAPDLESALAAHRRSGALATLVVREDPCAEELGAVHADESGRVRRIAGRGADRAGLRPFMFTGVHIVEPEIGEHLPRKGCVVRDSYIPLLESGARIGAWIDTGFFCDLGTCGRYLAANVDLVTGAARIAGFTAPDDGVLVAADARVDPRAELGAGAVVESGAELAAGARVERAVVLPGAAVRGELEDAIACPNGEIIRPASAVNEL
ncbi:MAG: sugar phosphate nucleotidyltransferase [Polyangia bacterium]